MLAAFWYLDFLPFQNNYSLGKVGDLSLGVAILLLIGVLLVTNDSLFFVLTRVRGSGRAINQEQAEQEKEALARIPGPVGLGP